MHRLFSKVATLFATTLLLYPSLRAESHEFVPLFRSVDNLDIFDTTNSARAARWQSLKDAGVETITLSVALLSPEDFWGNNRPSQAYLSETQLEDVKTVIDTYDFKVKVITGYGLRPSICDDNPTNMAALGVDAAEWEYTNVVQRLHNEGIEVDFIGTDGGYRRLIENSTKEGSCAIGSDKTPGTSDDHSLSASQAAQAMHVYYKTLRNRINLNQSTNVQVTHLFNLVNWETSSHAAPPAVDVNQSSLETLLSQIVSNLNTDSSANPLQFASVSIDYPVSYIEQTNTTHPKYAGGISGYKHRIGRLYWSGIQQSARWSPEIRQILTTSYTASGNSGQNLPSGYDGVVPCVWDNNDHISVQSVPYLPYRNSSNEKLNVEDATCFSSQLQEDQRYYTAMENFYQDVTGTYKNSSVPTSVIDHYRWQSWVAYPASTITFMGEIIDILP